MNTIWRSAFVGLVLICLSLLAAPSAFCRGQLLAEQTAASWGGPETKVECGKMGSMTGFTCKGLKCRKKTWKTCIWPKVILEQHRLVAKMYGPKTISNPNEQLRRIAKACLISGLALAGAPAVVAAPFSGDLSTDMIQTGVEACLKTQNLLSEIVAPGFEVTLEKTHSW